MNKAAMKVTRLEILEAASLTKLYELDAQFCGLQYDCVMNNWYKHARVAQEHLIAINREIARRF